MSLFALGVDCSTLATAMVVLDHTGYYQHRLVAHDTREQGARRLMQIRAAVGGVLDLAQWDLTVAAVEVPLNHNRSFALESCAAVVMECVQTRYPHLIVLDPTPNEWQTDTIGSGKDAKDRSLAHAAANGFDTDDDNLADAYCIAEYARELYIRDVLRSAA
jgi:Holliday junction resolvasome RuvABC endonuclease subunit